MSGACCQGPAKFDGVSRRFKRVLGVVIAINATMFAVEMIAGEAADSQALKADALDFLGDTATYAITLAVIGRSLLVRSLAATAKGVSLTLMGAWILGTTLWQVLGPGEPQAPVMGAIGALALAANLACVALLLSYRDGDANVRSVWLCSRNDAIGNVAVMLAALGVLGSGTAWPDLAVAALLAGLFISSSVRILAQAAGERRQALAAAGKPAAARVSGR